MDIDAYINIADLSERLDGDINFFRELADIFLRDYTMLLNNINTAIKERNPEKIRKTSHTIKGAVANFSADKAVAAAYFLEQIGANSKLEDAPPAYELLKNEIDLVVDSLRELKERESF